MSTVQITAWYLGKQATFAADSTQEVYDGKRFVSVANAKKIYLTQGVPATVLSQTYTVQNSIMSTAPLYMEGGFICEVVSVAQGAAMASQVVQASTPGEVSLCSLVRTGTKLQYVQVSIS